MVNISRYLDPSLVLFSEAVEQEVVLRETVALAYRAGRIPDDAFFLKAILDREQLVTTGIGMGIAIPHAKLPTLDDFFIAITILRRGVDWKALDGAPVRAVFLIGGPDDKPTEYLKILSGLTTLLNDEERRKKLIHASQVSDVMALFVPI